MSSSSTPRRPVRPQPTTGPPPMLQPQQPPQSYYTPSPFDPQPPQLQPAYQQPQQQQQLLAPQPQPQPPQTQVSSPPSASRKRKAPGTVPVTGLSTMSSTGLVDSSATGQEGEEAAETSPQIQAPKKSRTNTPWTPSEEQRLKIMRDQGNSWGEIAKTFPNRTEGSVKKHWYKDMHYADFAEDDSAALLQAIKEYEASKWKVIGQKVGKPAKACEQYAKEHFGGKI